MRRLPLLVVSLLALSALPPARAEEPAEEASEALTEADRAFARDQLVEEATRKVGSMRPTAERLDGIRAAIGEDIRFLTSYEPRDAEEAKLLEKFESTIQERILLVGRRGDGKEDPGEPGAILESVRLTRWLEGKEPCYVCVADPKDASAEVGEYPYPPSPPAPEAPPPAPEPDAPVEAGEGGAQPQNGAGGLGPAPAGPPPAEPGAGETAGEAPAPANGKAPDGGEKEAEGAAPGQTLEVAEPAKAWKPPSPAKWAETVVLPAEGTLRGKRIYPGVCGTVDQLLEAAKSSPIYQHPEVGRLVRHAIVDEDVFAYNLPSIAVRRVQARETLDVLEADVPASGLVDESMVDLQARRARRMRDNVRLVDGKRDVLLAHLDQMVDDLDAWKTQAALLSREIEDERGRMEEAAKAAQATPAADPAAEGTEPEPGEPGKEDGTEAGEADEEPVAPPKTLRLRLAEAHESLVGLDLRLFYLTVLRAERRLELLDLLRRAADSEATSAESVFTRYEEELVRIRNDRRLDRLRDSERRLRLWITSEQEMEPVEGTVGALRIAAYQAVLDVNAAAQEAVLRRRALTGRGTAAEAERRRLEEPDDDKPTTASSAKADPGDAPDQKQLNVLMRTPHLRTWDEKFIETARKELEDPELARDFNARLVADHYDAVNDRILALAESLEAAPDVPRMRESFEGIAAAAEQALEPLQVDYKTTVVRRVPRILTSSREDWDSALQGIEDQISRNRIRLAHLVEYRTALTNQGTRSLLVREGRTLNDVQLAAALEETGGAADRVGSWLAGRGSEHVGTFVSRRWVRLLLILVIAAVLVFTVRRTRRRVDRWIQEKAAVHPELRGTGVSVEQEQEEVRRRKEEEAEVRAAASTEVLTKVVEEPEPEPEPEPAPPEESGDVSGPEPGEEPGERPPERAEGARSRQRPSTSEPVEPADPLTILDEDETADEADRKKGGASPNKDGAAPKKEES